MRSEQQMLRLITEVARADDRIRAVIMNGSRANPEAPKDCFQDFDIVYFVTDVEPYVHNRSWIARFGELMIMQMPEDMGEPPPADNGGFAYLMQFADGNRIDLTLFPISRLDEGEEDSLTQVLLDKDGIFDHIAPSSAVVSNVINAKKSSLATAATSSSGWVPMSQRGCGEVRCSMRSITSITMSETS